MLKIAEIFQQKETDHKTLDIASCSVYFFSCLSLWNQSDSLLQDSTKYLGAQHFSKTFTQLKIFLVPHQCSTLENLLKSANLWSHPRLGNLDGTRNASSPGFFFKALISIFQTINMGVGHKLLLQLFLIGFCLFCSKIGKS